MGDFLDNLNFIAIALLWVVGGLIVTWIGISVAGLLASGYERIFAISENIRERKLQTELRAADVLQRLNEAALVRPDLAGNFPLHKDYVLEAGDKLIALAGHKAEMQRTFPNVPNTYSPKWEYENRALPGAQVVTADPAHQLPLVVPDFWQLFTSDKLPESKFLLGYSLEDQTPVEADWGNLYSALVGGQSGSGKSTLIRGLLAQAALKGSQFVVIDPHSESGEQSLAYSIRPLRGFMPFDPAGGTEQIMLDALRYVAGVARARLGDGGHGDRTPLVLVVDELTSILQGRYGDTLRAEMIDGLQQIATESRKVGVFAFGIGQNFHGKDFPTTVRDNFVSMISCHARARVAKTMADDNEFGKIAGSLQTGQAIWQPPSGDFQVFAFPNTTEKHLTLVARQVADNGVWEVDPGSYAPTTGKGGVQVASKQLPLGVHTDENWPTEAPADATRTPRGRHLDAKADARTVTVRDMVLQGVEHTKIIEAVWGVNSQAGRPYRVAKAEFEAMLAGILSSLIGGD